MFKKLKDKIAEEVKQSPLKSVQQLAQAVVSPSSSSVFEPSSSNDKFCIEEGDIEEEEQAKSTPMKPAGGFTSVTLTGQTSSPLREQNRGFRSSNASFTTESDSLFPVFEPQPTNFHVQSDWESASEVEDRYSQLEHISKESLYEAYRKVFNKYNKMKNKYHELVTHYRQLERERDKAKTVLTETQDKALLRISELREQCALEQHAKAHLEEALRNELEERDHIINTLRTKVQYLKTATESAASESVDAKDPPKEEIDNLIDFTDNASISKVPLPSIASTDKEFLEWYDLQFSNCNQYLLDKFAELKTLKHSLERKKNNGLKENQNSETVICDESQNQNSKEEISISQSFRSFIDDLEREVKLLQENTKEVLRLKDVECLVYVEQRRFESTCENPHEESSNTITRERRTVNPGGGDGAVAVDSSQSTKKMCDLQNEIEKHLTIIRDVQTENELLSKKLQEEISTSEKLRTDIRLTTGILDLIKSQVKAINETFETGNYDAIEINLSQESDNELIQDIHYCLANMRNTIFELEKLKLDKVKLERELGLIKDQIKASESVKSYEDNINRELIEANDKLREELESLQNENNVKLSEKESFIIEKNELKRAITEYESRVENLTDAVSQMEKLCASKQQELNQMDLDFNEEKHVLQSKILHLEKELEQAKLEYSQLLENRDQLRSDYTTLKKEKEDFTRQRAEVKKNIKDTKEAFEKSKNELLKNLEIKASEIDALKAQNQEAYTKASNLEKGLLTRTTDEERFLTEISSLNQQLEVMFSEKDVFQNKIQNLEKELEKSKQNHGSFLKTVQLLSNKMCSLKSEKSELITEMHCLKETLTMDFENIKTNFKLVEENREQILGELKLLKKGHSELTEENFTLQEKVLKLEKIIENNCKELLSSAEDKNKLENEITILKCHYDTKNKDYEAFKNEFNNLLKDLESTRKKHSLVLTEKTEISVELDSLKKEYNSMTADLKNTKKELQSIFNKETEKRQTDHAIAEEMKHMFSVELAVVTEERDKIVIENNSLNSKLEQLEEDLKLCKEDLSSLKEDKENLASEFLELKKEYDAKVEETSMAKDAFDKLLKDYEDLKSSYSSVSESKRKLLEDLESIRKSQDETVVILNDTRQELHCQQEKCININQRFIDLSELFKVKCHDHEQICQESIELKTELDNANQKVDEMNGFIGVMAKEKNELHNNLLAMLGLVKDTKQIQNYLMNFIFQFKTSFIDELNTIKTKINNDLTKHINSILDKNKFYSERINELECKTKKAMDSYNSTIKNHQRTTENKALKEKRKEEKDSDEAVLRDKENGLCLNDYEKNHHDNHVATKPPLFNHYEAELSDENLTDHANDWELQDFDGLDSDNSQSKLAAPKDVETKYTSEEFQRCSSKENTVDIRKLQQEIILKDDIIKKLQYIVDEYEQEKKNVDDAKKTEGSKLLTNSSLTQFFKSDDLAASNIKLAETNVTCSMLEQENKTLMDRLLKVKEDYEEKLNNLIIDYEKQLEEERNNQESGSLVGEKKHMINEMKEQIENLQEDLEERGDAYERLYEEHNEFVKSHEEEIQQVRINYEKEMREQDKKWRSCLDRRLAEEESRHQEELTQMTHEWLAERKELETESRLATSVVESGSGSSELLRRQVQALTVQLHQLQNQRCDSCDQKVFPKERRKSSGSSRSIQDCTEMEYLRNILYEYMMGKEPLVLAKVLCALVKFDDTQTKDIVLKEEQKITLLGQLGILT